MKKTGEPAQPKIKNFKLVRQPGVSTARSLPFKHWFASPVQFALPREQLADFRTVASF